MDEQASHHRFSACEPPRYLLVRHWCYHAPMTEQRVAIVTGAARGIGRAALLALAGSGAIPIGFDLDPPSEAAALMEELRALGTEPGYARVDVTSSGDVADAVGEIAERYGRIDILVNNAGILSTTRIDELIEAEWRRVIDVNLTGTFNCTSAVVPWMKRGGWGRIVSVASMAGRMGGIAVGPAYAASKAGMIGLTWNLARNLAPTGITVNVIAPGPTDGAMYDGFTAAERATLERSIPVGRLGRPEEIGELVAYLCSDAAGYISGAVIDVNGAASTG
jgi:3-oxoacyl-[acyl-carrier protein] reductase